MVYVVSFKSSNEALGKIIDGVWSVYSSLEQAEDGIAQYMQHYNETLFEALHKDNGAYLQVVNDGIYIIDQIPLNEPF